MGFWGEDGYILKYSRNVVEIWPTAEIGGIDIGGY